MRTRVFVVLILMFFCTGCQPEKPETATRGNLHVLIPESVAPALIEEVNQFLSLYAKHGAHITYAVVSSDEAIGQFIRDTLRCIFTTRPLSADERAAFASDPKQLVEILIAYDGIGVVVHYKNPLERITTRELRDILTGKVRRWEQLSKGGSMRGRIEVVYQDSSDISWYVHKRIAERGNLRRDVSRSQSTLQTLQSVARQPLSIGLVGIDWIDSAKVPAKVLEIAETEQPTDTTLRVAPEAIGKYYPRHPAHIYRNYYPFKRAIYLYARASRGTLVSGFGTYVASKEGQQIFLKRKLVPGTQPIRLRPTE